jgi:hypothetical protein
MHRGGSLLGKARLTSRALGALGGCSALLLLSSCGPDPWESFPMPVSPDRECRFGHEQVHDIYLWNCFDRRRVVIFRRCTAYGCQGPQKQTVHCGAHTEIEKEFKLEKDCKPPPSTYRWVVSKKNGGFQ